MKQQARLLAGLGAGLFILSGSAVAGVVGSKHDLTAVNANDGQQVCVYCHTPHGADETVTAAPLWNKSLPDGTLYSTYTSSTMDGTADLSNSVSLACLSCHDGASATDSVINAPTTASGAYNYVSGGAVMGGVAGTFMATTNPVPAVAGDASQLANDHPIGIPYAGGGATYGTAYSSADAAYKDPAFEAIANTSSKSLAGGLLPLYKVGTTAYVECASCHDPHDDTNVPFLRVSSANSAVCTTCHIK